jgi:hypothetical protein
MSKRTFSLVAMAAATVLQLGCYGASTADTNGVLGDDEGATGPGGTNGGGPPGSTLPQRLCSGGRTYTGLGGVQLEATRSDVQAGTNRSRFKPYSALRTDYTRVLGAKPALVDTVGSTFGQPPARWSEEPQASAVNLFTAYRVAFQGCLAYTGTAAAYANAPTSSTAATECAAFARKFWSRVATQEELDGCVNAAMVDAATETNLRRRWAYACASVLSSAGFLTF